MTMTMNMHILSVPAVLNEEHWNLLLSQVSSERREKAARFVHRVDAYRSVLGEVLARVTLGQKLGLRPDELSFTQNAYGKPSLLTRDPDGDVPFNLSHSGSWIALISGGRAPLGVDVEQIAPIDMHIAERFFSKEENGYLATLPAAARLEAFYRLWTLKESYIKAVGTGLSMPLESFSILPDGAGHWHCPQTRAYRFFSQRLDDTHMLAACSTAGELPQQPEIVTMEEILEGLVR